MMHYEGSAIKDVLSRMPYEGNAIQDVQFRMPFWGKRHAIKDVLFMHFLEHAIKDVLFKIPNWGHAIKGSNKWYQYLRPDQNME